MSQTFFISDLHLNPSRPDIIALAATFLRERAVDGDALYILGDLFEYWIGDDQPTTGLEPLLVALDELSRAGVPVHFIAGNRDFLIGDDFCRKHGIRLLQDGAVIDLHGVPTLLMHGDVLCTDDSRYQQLRTLLRDPAWQQQFLALPLGERIKQAQSLREQSENETREKDAMIMDVNDDAVRDAMRRAGVRRLIHGHTHRPAIHEFTLDEEHAERIVLGDWYSQGSVLTCSTAGCRLDTIVA